MLIQIDDPALVLLIGSSGSGKSTFARRHFRPTEVLSSDFCRGLVCDDENDQTATSDAFELLHFILSKRLARHRTTVVDATNVQDHARLSLLSAAKVASLPVVAVVFLLPEEVCQRRNQQRPNRVVPSEVIQQQLAALAASNQQLAAEGFQAIHRLTSEAEIDNVAVVRPAESYS